MTSPMAEAATATSPWETPSTTATCMPISRRACGGLAHTRRLRGGHAGPLAPGRRARGGDAHARGRADPRRRAGADADLRADVGQDGRREDRGARPHAGLPVLRRRGRGAPAVAAAPRHGARRRAPAPTTSRTSRREARRSAAAASSTCSSPGPTCSSCRRTAPRRRWRPPAPRGRVPGRRAGAGALRLPRQGYPAFTAAGKPALFLVNGQPPAAGAPSPDPCPPGAPVRTYRAAYVQTNAPVNRAGWHDAQARMIVLEKDVEAALDGTRSAGAAVHPRAIRRDASCSTRRTSSGGARGGRLPDLHAHRRHRPAHPPREVRRHLPRTAGRTASTTRTGPSRWRRWWRASRRPTRSAEALAAGVRSGEPGARAAARRATRA